MSKNKEGVAQYDFRMGDIVRLMQDEMFWEVGSGGRKAVTKKAGTDYVVADFSYENGTPEAVILEEYDPVLKRAWLCTVALDQVEFVSRVSASLA